MVARASITASRPAQCEVEQCELSNTVRPPALVRRLTNCGGGVRKICGQRKMNSSRYRGKPVV